MNEIPSTSPIPDNNDSFLNESEYRARTKECDRLIVELEQQITQLQDKAQARYVAGQQETEGARSALLDLMQRRTEVIYRKNALHDQYRLFAFDSPKNKKEALMKKEVRRDAIELLTALEDKKTWENTSPGGLDSDK